MFCLSQKQFSEFLQNKKIIGYAKLRYSIYATLEKATKTRNIIPVHEAKTDRKAYCYVDFVQTMQILHPEKQAMRLSVRLQLNLVGSSIAIEEPVTIYEKENSILI